MTYKYITVGIGVSNKQRFFTCICFEFSSLIFVVLGNDFVIVFDRKGGVAFRKAILLEHSELKLTIYYSNICLMVFSLSLADLTKIVRKNSVQA